MNDRSIPKVNSSILKRIQDCSSKGEWGCYTLNKKKTRRVPYNLGNMNNRYVKRITTIGRPHRENCKKDNRSRLISISDQEKFLELNGSFLPKERHEYNDMKRWNLIKIMWQQFFSISGENRWKKEEKKIKKSRVLKIIGYIEHIEN